MRLIVFLLITATIFGVQITEIVSFPIPQEIEPIAVKADGAGRYYILTAGGRFLAFERDSMVMELDPTAREIDWIEPVDIGYSSGWLYIADKTGGAIFLTDKYLRSPTKIELNNDNRTVRPEDIAVSTDGRILIWDDDYAELLLFEDWTDESPTRLAFPEINKPRSLEIRFDFKSNSFFVINGNNLSEFSVLGVILNNLKYPSPESDVVPMAAGTIMENLFLVDNRGVWSFTDDAWNFHLPANPVSADISIRGRIILIENDTLKAFEVDESK